MPDLLPQFQNELTRDGRGRLMRPADERRPAGCPADYGAANRALLTNSRSVSELTFRSIGWVLNIGARAY